MKAKLDLANPEARKAYAAAVDARRRIAGWPAWKRGEHTPNLAAETMPTPVQNCSSVETALRKKLGLYPTASEHEVEVALDAVIYDANMWRWYGKKCVRGGRDD